MSELDITKALDAGANSGFDRGNDSRHEIASRIIAAALPHILDALAEQAGEEYHAAFAEFARAAKADEPAGEKFRAVSDIAAVVNWLRAKAEAARD